MSPLLGSSGTNPSVTDSSPGIPTPCARRHVGPFDPRPELDGWLGTDWVLCRECRTTVTSWTAQRQASHPHPVFQTSDWLETLRDPSRNPDAAIAASETDTAGGIPTDRAGGA
jgi:hypothetical protein